ncbi:retrovirus-related Pol polyprotein from transposon 17.6 [Trichonephila clavipes]|nr:retrovirus-related Pol polyprotein from transposon 17.6 [Trichonephila clavipes]
MDDLLQEAKHTAYISTIDLKSGYHQVNVNPADRDKTAFVCPLGTYRFKRMPFGLKYAPATFQRLMDIFRRGLPVLAYLDNIIIMSPTFEQHLEDLDAVFKRLMDFKLRANREECQFSCSRVKYLGLWITPQGIEVDHKKTSAILGTPPPKNVKQLQSFLQTCSWYRKFIANFSEIARPLSNLTRKRLSGNGQRRGESISDLEAMFGEQSSYKEKTKKNIQLNFASRLLNPAERNYSTTEREPLAVVWAVNKFRGYIDGASITVASDHQPLRWLMKLKSPTGRLARWALQLQSFNLNMEYIPGKSNVIADMLSRPACNEENELCEVCTVAIDVPSRYAPDSESEEAQLVIPSHERTLILKNHHDAPMAGHYGAEGTYTRIAKNYYWTRMRKYITDYVKHCPDCIKYKASNQKHSGLLQTPVPAQRFETLAIDLFGALPEGKDGKRWILIIEDCTTKWVELFALPNATAEECAITLIEEVLLREVVEEQLDSRKFYADKKRKAAPTYQPGEYVFVASHPLSNAGQGRSAKLMPGRDGPYVILTQRSPSSYEIASLDNSGVPLGVYHTSALTPCNIDKVKPLIPLRKRSRPPKVPQTPGSSSGRRRNQERRM